MCLIRYRFKQLQVISAVHANAKRIESYLSVTVLHFCEKRIQKKNALLLSRKGDK